MNDWKTRKQAGQSCHHIVEYRKQLKMFFILLHICCSFRQ